tara:strand:+ start:59 stop:229 length:171 start_codon:yes stop_codon:yes gene_type:complete
MKPLNNSLFLSSAPFAKNSTFLKNVNQQVVNLFHSKQIFLQNASKSKNKQLIRGFL